MFLNQTTPAAPTGDDSGSIAPPGTTGPDGETGDVRLTALREALDNAGYRNVRFRMNGGVLQVWGTVPDEFDRINVQMLIFRTTGITLLDDKLRVHDVYAEP
jgi:hypothetical protein